MPQINEDTVDSVFSYHQPKDDQPHRYEAMRDAARKFAWEIIGLCPESPERTLALRDVQRAVMMANAAIALNE
jgi:hypothetical protein